METEVEFELDDNEPTPAPPAPVPDDVPDAELTEFEAANPADPAIEGTEGLA